MNAARAAHGEAPVSILSAKINVIEIDVRAVDGQYFRFQTAPFSIDLVNLKAGYGDVWGRVSLPEGQYDQIRLRTEESGEVEFDDHSKMELRIPSGPQSGLKIFADPYFSVEAGKITIGVLDFDLSDSFVVTRHFVNFKPVIRIDCSNPIVVNPGGGSSTTGGSDGSSTSGGDSSSTTGGSDGSSTSGGTAGSTSGGSTSTTGGTDGSTTGGADGSTTGGDGTLPGDGSDSNFPIGIGI